MKYWLLCLLILIILPQTAAAQFCTNTPADTIFCDDFETGDLSRWDGFDAY